MQKYIIATMQTMPSMNRMELQFMRICIHVAKMLCDNWQIGVIHTTLKLVSHWDVINWVSSRRQRSAM